MFIGNKFVDKWQVDKFGGVPCYIDLSVGIVHRDYWCGFKSVVDVECEVVGKIDDVSGTSIVFCHFDKSSVVVF